MKRAAAHALFQQLGDFGDAGFRAGVVHFLTGARAADAADGVGADLNRHAAAEREDVGDIPLGASVGSLAVRF